MIEAAAAPVLPTAGAPAGAPAGVTARATLPFALPLASPLPSTAMAAPPAIRASSPRPGVRPETSDEDDAGQDSAAPGSALPDATDDRLDSRLLWLPAGLLPTPTAPPALASKDWPTPAAATPSAGPVDAPRLPPVTAPEAATTALPIPLSPSFALPPPPAGAAIVMPTIVAAPVALGTLRGAKPTGEPGQIVRTGPKAAAGFAFLNAAGDTAPEAAAPAREAFAALFQANLDDHAAPHAQPAAPAPALDALLATTAAPPATAAPADVPATAVDLTTRNWPQAMADHIAVLRDAGDTALRESRVRLVPEHLGAIDIAVRSVGEAIHVHFHTESAEARTLIADARPQLAQAAEARGIRIAQTSVDLGGTGANAGQSNAQARWQPPQPAAPAPATAAATDDETTDTSTRLA